MILLGALGFVGLQWPKALAYPMAVVFVWLALGWLIQAVKLWRHRQRDTAPAPKTEPRRESAA